MRIFQASVLVVLTLAAHNVQPIFANDHASAKLGKRATSSALTLTIRGDWTTTPTEFGYGYLFEDINNGSDGGVYAELLCNRAVSQTYHGAAPTTTCYSAVGNGTISVDTNVPLNTAHRSTLRLDVSGAGTGTRVGFNNIGFEGIRIDANTQYYTSFWVKSSGNFQGPINFSIEDTSGNGTVYASTALNGVTNVWTKFTLALHTTQDTSLPKLTNAFFVTVNNASANGQSLWFDTVSLFPPTYGNTANGNRLDILVAVNPSVFRWPGGNNVEGSNYLTSRVFWNQTIGDTGMRAGYNTSWGYANTGGLGTLEFMILCEHLGAEAVLDVFAGYDLSGTSAPDSTFPGYIQEALNQIEYIKGNTSTTYGALRAAHGHPAPFKLNYVEIGNEDFFSSDYSHRYPIFYNGLKAAHPEITFIATTTTTNGTLEVIDDHYYATPADIRQNLFHKYDGYSRSSYKIFVGEFACQASGGYGVSSPNLLGALGDATFLIGLERNGDIVKWAAYAPLLQRTGPAAWIPDLIVYNGMTSYGIPSYYVMLMFSTHRGDSIIPVIASGPFDPMFWVAVRNTTTGQLFVKAANWDSIPWTVTFNVTGYLVGSQGQAQVISGNTTAINSFTQPTLVSPTTSTFSTANIFSFTFPANSVAVLEIPTSTDTDLYGILNGGFETGTLSPWQGQWNANLVGVEPNHPSSGTYDAYIHPTNTLECAIYQGFSANTTGTYTLSVRADTSIPNQVQLGVDVDGVQANVTIIATGGYQTYTLTFVAAAGNWIKVWFYSPAATGTYTNGPWATLDNVQITSIVPGLFGILNGGFESGTLNPWQGQWNVDLVGIETNNPNSGIYDAYLHPTSTLDCAIYQDFTARTTRTYTLSARADTSIASLVQLGVDVKGVQANKTIIATGGYATYTITFAATAGDLIKVWFYSPKATGWATLDDVQVI